MGNTEPYKTGEQFISNVPQVEALKSVTEKYKIALDTLREIEMHGGVLRNGILGTGKWASQRASSAIIKITTMKG
jgi:hypothetical protein